MIVTKPKTFQLKNCGGSDNRKARFPTWMRYVILEVKVVNVDNHGASFLSVEM